MSMNINGYELESVAFMTRNGPLWHTHDEDGTPALVVLRPGGEGEAAQERWQAWARVEDPHVVRLLDVARHRDGRWAVVMERVEGQTLEALSALGRPRDLASRRRIVGGLRTGLAALHGAGLVHGDVAPANVVVRPDGTPVLVDLVDPVDTVLGTPGWSQGGAGGTQGDRAALGAIARALRVAEDPEEDGEGAVQGSGTGAGADVQAGDPEAAEVLRRLAHAPATEVEEVPRRRLGPVVGVLAVGALVLAVALVAAVRPWSAGAGVDDPSTRADWACPGEERIGVLLEELLRERDRALVAGDVEALGVVLEGSALEGDRRLAEGLARGGTRLTDLGTRLEQVKDVSCTAGAVEVAATLRQTTLARCTSDGRCEEVGPQQAHRVVLHLGGPPWKVQKVSPG